MLARTPYNFQREGGDFALSHHYCIIGDEMGLGKTIQAILVQYESDLRCVVVCPAYMRDTWRKEIMETIALPPDIYVCYDKSDIEYLQKLFFKEKELKLGVVVISYDQLEHATAIFRWARLYIADEAHYLKNVQAKRTRIFHSYVQGFAPERLVLLSGTPIKNNASEWFSLICLCSYNPKGTSGIDVRVKYPSFYSFADRFSKRKEARFGGKKMLRFIGAQNIPELLEILKGKYIRRKASKILDLPATVHKEVLCTWRDDDVRLKRAWDGYLDKDAIVEAKKHSAIAKAEFTANYLSEMLENGARPIVVFSDHLIPLEIMAEKLGKDHRVAIIRGDVTPKKREKIVEEFQKDVYDVLLCTIGAASAGFTLTKSCNMVFNDIPWVPADLWQAQKRIHRIGQSETCFYHYIHGSPMDAKISKTVRDKMKILEAAL